MVLWRHINYHNVENNRKHLDFCFWQIRKIFSYLRLHEKLHKVDLTFFLHDPEKLLSLHAYWQLEFSLQKIDPLHSIFFVVKLLPFIFPQLFFYIKKKLLELTSNPSRTWNLKVVVYQNDPYPQVTICNGKNELHTIGFT